MENCNFSCFINKIKSIRASKELSLEAIDNLLRLVRDSEEDRSIYLYARLKGLFVRLKRVRNVYQQDLIKTSKDSERLIENELDELIKEYSDD